MKRKILLLLKLTVITVCHSHAQTGTTAYGDFTSPSGNYNSYFGYRISPYGVSSSCTIVGAESLEYGGIESTAVGRDALSGGHGCTAIGFWALKHNQREYQDYMTPQAGYYNTGVGYKCLEANLYGDYNTAVGTEALYANKASQNVAVGHHAMHANVDGTRNSAIGTFSLYSNLGYDNTGNGHRSLYANTTGSYNTATGSSSLYSNVSGDLNTANGYSALHDNTTGYNNTATGAYSLNANTAGTFNTATGRSALSANGTGHYNTAMGASAMNNNESGTYNAATGYASLYSNTSGGYNSASGSYSLYANTIGTNNTANGYRALYSNTGSNNTAIGSYCMNANVNGAYNTAVGHYAFADNTTGNRNSAEGFRALDNNTTGSYNTAQGAHALNYISSGSYNSALGYDAGPTLGDLNNTTAIGYLAVPTASNQVRIGNASVTSIGGQVEWTAFSDGRFKKDIKDDVSGLDFIKRLRPVSYTVDRDGLNRFLHVSDSSSKSSEAKSMPVRQTGFIAQEVEALVKKSGYVFSGVDAPDNENDPYGIRYAEFVVPLVKAVQELSASDEAQQQLIEEQQKQIESLRKQLGLQTDNHFEAGSTAVLLQNNPNPFNAETNIQATLPDHVGYATIMIYNLEGRELKTIQVPERGEVQITISAGELSAGMYLYSLIADGKVVDTKRMVLTK